MKYFILLLFAFSCANTQQHRALEEGSQVKLRSLQTKAFNMTNKKKMLMAVMGALQDLNFQILKGDHQLGIVQAVKLGDHPLTINVRVWPKGEKQMLVRANAEYRSKMVKDPRPYQDFFRTLSRAIFLEGQAVH